MSVERENARKWSRIIAEAYVEGAHPKPPSWTTGDLGDRMVDKLDIAFCVGIPEIGWAGFVNPVIDEFERQTGIRGPRLQKVEYGPDRAIMTGDAE